MNNFHPALSLIIVSFIFILLFLSWFLFKSIKFLLRKIFPTLFANNNEITFLLHNQDSFYSKMYSNHLLFNQNLEEALKILNDPFSTTKEQNQAIKICEFEIDNSIVPMQVAKSYGEYAVFENKKGQEIYDFKAIKNISYSLNVMKLDVNLLRLAKFLIGEFEREVIEFLGDVKSISDIIQKYFTGYKKDELKFLKKLLELNIPKLSARCLYRISCINLLGKASVDDLYEINLELASNQINQVIELSKIQQSNNLNIVFTVDENYIAHVATALASALINSDLDTVYTFYFIMDPNNPISELSQNKLSSMQNIRKYKIEFVVFDEQKVDLSEINTKCKNSIKRFSKMIFYKPFIHEILDNISDVLYLDGDLLVLRDLTSFKKLNMEDYILAGAQDLGNNSSYWMNRVNFMYNNDAFNYYVNVGVMYLNLENMRHFKITNKILNFANSSNYKGSDCPEQDLINNELQNFIKHIPSRWNYSLMRSSFSYININNILHLPFILHYYATPEKPWKQTYNPNPKNDMEMYMSMYWNYRTLTPFN
jgi:lipopolysaccharide biosynthesis glycosyltransferase